MKKIIRISQILLGIIFILSFVGKIANDYDFFVFLGKLNVPNTLFHIVYIVVLTGELVLGIHLLLGLHFRTVIILSITTYFVFTVILIYAFAKGINASCGCFGGWVQSDVSLFSIVRNIFIMLLFLLLYVRRDQCYTVFKPYYIEK